MHMVHEMLLEIKKIKKSFFGAEVLHGINFDVKKGEVLGLVGENGAGKSTLMSIMGGVYDFNGGEMRMDGNPYKPTKPNDAADVGISFIHQEFSLFSYLSVAENMFIDNFPMKGISIDKKAIQAGAQKYIDLFHLDISPKTKIEELPMGIRQIIEISKALQKKSKLMIFDEPTTSLSPKEKNELFEIIGELRDQGVSIIFISHILEDVMELCDRITIIRDGNSVGTYDKADIDKHKMIKLMVGRDLNQIYPKVEKEILEPVYEVKHFIREGSAQAVSFDLKRGEIVGMFGLMGAGRTELLRALFGVDTAQSGEIYIGGQRLNKPTPKKCIDKGMAFVTEDRRKEGLIMAKSVDENVVMVVLGRLVNAFNVVNVKREKQIASDAVKQFSVKAANPGEQLVSSLSGGNQQKVVLAKWMASEPKIFFLDEPTRGVDVGAKYEIYTYINELAKTGCAVLVVSSEMEEVMGICDRILVMHKDSIVADVPKAEFNQERIIQYALEGGLSYAEN